MSKKETQVQNLKERVVTLSDGRIARIGMGSGATLRYAQRVTKNGDDSQFQFAMMAHCTKFEDAAGTVILSPTVEDIDELPLADAAELVAAWAELNFPQAKP